MTIFLINTITKKQNDDDDDKPFHPLSPLMGYFIMGLHNFTPIKMVTPSRYISFFIKNIQKVKTNKVKKLLIFVHLIL